MRLLDAQVLMRKGRLRAALEGLTAANVDFEAADDSWGVYHALSLTENVLFWKGDVAGAAEACVGALHHATTPDQRAHTLLSLASAENDMRHWDAAEACIADAEALLGVNWPLESARAQALRANVLFFKGEMLAAREHLPDDAPTLTPSFQAALANARGLLLTELAEYDQAEACLVASIELAQKLGFEIFAGIAHDNLGLLRSAQGCFQDGLEEIGIAQASQVCSEDKCFRASTLSHQGTALRWWGRWRESIEVYALAADLVPLGRDPYFALNCRANSQFSRALCQLESGDDLLLTATEARQFGLHFVAHKAELFAGILHFRAGREEEALDLLLSCLPEQLRLGHYHLVIQELCLHDTIDWVCERTGSPLQSELKALAPLHWSRGAKRRVSPESCPSVGTSLFELTRRELEVLELMATGARNPEIASRLFLSSATVKTHINHIFTKLDVDDRVQAVLKYRHASPEASAPRGAISTRPKPENTTKG